MGAGHAGARGAPKKIDSAEAVRGRAVLEGIIIITLGIIILERIEVGIEIMIEIEGGEGAILGALVIVGRGMKIILIIFKKALLVIFCRRN